MKRLIINSYSCSLHFFIVIFPTQVTAKIPGTATSRPIDTAFGVGVCFIVYLTKMRGLQKKIAHKLSLLFNPHLGMCKPGSSECS